MDLGHLERPPAWDQLDFPCPAQPGCSFLLTLPGSGPHGLFWGQHLPASRPPTSSFLLVIPRS